MAKLNLDKIKENNIMKDNKIKFTTNESNVEILKHAIIKFLKKNG